MANYMRPVNYSLEERWDELGQELHIPQYWWDTMLKGICQTDEFKEISQVIDQRRYVASTFKELNDQLTEPDQCTLRPEPYTGDEAIEALRDGELSLCKSIVTVMLHYCMSGEEGESVKTYCWSLYQLGWPSSYSDKAAYAVALDPPFKTAMHLLERQKTRELLDAFEIRQSWNEGGQLAQVFYDERFRKVIKIMAAKEVLGQHMYTQFSDVFSLIRGKEVLGPQRAIEDIRPPLIATIVLDHGKDMAVQVWKLSRNTKAQEYLHEVDWVNVYDIADDFREVKHWAGLRGLFDIDESWWDKLLLRLCQQQSFGDLLKTLNERQAIGESIYPQFNNIFSWTRVPECKPEDVKVIIVGQDPVHDNRATGMSFLFVEEGEGKSIENIFRSVKDNFEIVEDINHLCPYSWCQQGVLLLNTLMTIGKDQKGQKRKRHTSIGWEQITTGILEYFIDCQKDRSLHILLWSGYWKSGHGGQQTGDKSPIEKLRKKVSGRRTRVIHNTHPSPRNGDTFFNETAIEKKLFKEEVTTVGWTTIRDGMPSIPAGVIHPTIDPTLPEQFAQLDVDNKKLAIYQPGMVWWIDCRSVLTCWCDQS